MHEIRFLPGQGWWVWPESGGKERKIVELAQQVIYHIKVVLVVYSRSRALILGLTERRNNTKYTIKLQDTATILPVSDAFFIYIFTKLHYHERFRHNFWPSSGISKLVK